jgi:hypothetical protein
MAKSEIRNPKSERSSKSETRNPKANPGPVMAAGFGLRASDFFRISGFGFRICFVIRHSSLVIHLRISLLLCALALSLTGCAGYRLGPTNGMAAREKSVQISPFANRTLEPRLTDAVTSQLRKQMQRDATYRLATNGDGDIAVTGVITAYERIEVSFAPNDTLTVRDYRLALTAHVTARERSSGHLILDQPVTGYTLIRVGSDLTSTERQSLPLLAADLARNVVGLLADGSW